MAQRLVRTICPDCKVVFDPHDHHVPPDFPREEGALGWAGGPGGPGGAAEGVPGPGGRCPDDGVAPRAPRGGGAAAPPPPPPPIPSRTE